MTPEEKRIYAQEKVRMAQFQADLGGDVIATRCAHALYRSGIESMSDLKTVLKAVGPDEFRERLLDTRTLGAKCINRIADVLEGAFSREGIPGQRGELRDWDLPTFRALPKGLEDRLEVSLEDFDPDSAGKKSPINREVPDGLNYEDLERLRRLLFGGHTW